MKNTFLVIIYFISVGLVLNAQVIELKHEWSNQLLGNPYVEDMQSSLEPLKIAKDMQGDILSAGVYHSVSTSYNLDYSHFFIKKADPDGEFKWLKDIGESDSLRQVRVIGLKSDTEDNICVFGLLDGFIDLDPGLGEETIGVPFTDTIRTIFVAKYNPNGDFIWSWSHSFPEEASSIRGRDMDINPLTNSISILVDYKIEEDMQIGPQGAEETLPNTNFATNSFVMDLSSDGDFNWLRILGPGAPYYSTFSTSVIYDDEGGLLVTGLTTTTFIMDELEIGAAGSPSIFLIRLVEGNNTEILHYFSPFVSNPYASSSGVGLAQPIVLFKNGADIWLSGLIRENIKVDGQLLIQYTSLSSSVFFLKIDPGAEDLVLFEIESCEGGYRHAVAGNGEDILLIKGKFSGSRDFDWSLGTEDILTSTGSFNPYIMGVTTEGEFLFVEKIPSSNHGYLYDVVYTGNNRFVYSGSHSGESDLGINIDSSVIHTTEHVSGLELEVFVYILEAVCKETIEIAVDADGILDLAPEMLDAGSYNNYGSDLLFSLNTNFYDCQDLGEDQNIVLTVEDAVTGNIDTCETYVEIIDNLPPTALCQDLTIYITEVGVEQISPESVDAGSYDNCNLETMTLTQRNFYCGDVGVNFVQLKVTDIGGLTSSCTAMITVVDELAPTLKCGSLDVYLDENGNIEDADFLSQGIVSDNCGIDSYDLFVDGDVCTSSSDNLTGELMAVDNSGNFNSCELDIFVYDTIKPIVNCLSVPFVFEEADEVVTFTEDILVSELSDNCLLSGLSFSPSALTKENLGQSEVLVEATDTYGNTSSCIAVVYLDIPFEKENLVYVPNVFSPNKDGVNDQLPVFASSKVERIEYFTIYDRWGNIHYKEKDKEPVNSGLGWTGMMAGQKSPKGTYFYTLRVLAINGEYFDFYGSVNLL